MQLALKEFIWEGGRGDGVGWGSRVGRTGLGKGRGGERRESVSNMT